jgi:hypothetical protein
LASLAFGNISFWLCDTIGAIFAGMAAINLIRYFGDNKEAPSEEAAVKEEAATSNSWGGSPVN